MGLRIDKMTTENEEVQEFVRTHANIIIISSMKQILECILVSNLSFAWPNTETILASDSIF